MRLWQHLKNWEKSIELAPKQIILKTLLIYFCLSLFLGILLASFVQAIKFRLFKQHEIEVKQAEISRMNELVEKLKNAKMSNSDTF